jgi:hypothetical protein
MISEDRLRELLDVAADSYPAPPDGIERIHAATLATDQPSDADRLEARQRRRHWLRVGGTSMAFASVVGLLIAAAVLTGGSSSTSNSVSSGPAIAPGAGAASSAAGSSAGQSADSLRGPVSGSEAAPLPQAASTGSAAPGAAAPRIVETGTADLQVRPGQVPAALDKLRALATGFGGVVAASDSSSGPSPTGSVTLRVPTSRFTDLQSRLSTIGTVTSSSSSAKDVTGAYVDLQARLRALAATRDTYLTLLSKAATIGDTLSVQQRVDAIQQQIEQLEGQRQVLADQSDLATLEVNVSEKGAPVTVPPTHHDSGFSGAIHRAWHRFTGGLEAVVAASGTVALILIALALVTGGGRVVYRTVRRRMV